jgi:hypothetical protein
VPSRSHSGEHLTPNKESFSERRSAPFLFKRSRPPCHPHTVDEGNPLFLQNSLILNPVKVIATRIRLPVPKGFLCVLFIKFQKQGYSLFFFETYHILVFLSKKRLQK